MLIHFFSFLSLASWFRVYNGLVFRSGACGAESGMEGGRAWGKLASVSVDRGLAMTFDGLPYPADARDPAGPSEESILSYGRRV